jgi:single-strand DNA-binding protein
MLPKITGVGNLTKDPDLRYTPNGKAVCTLSLAFNEGKEENKKSIFLEVSVWEKTAEACAKFLVKGSQVNVAGRLSERSWDGQDGKKFTKFFIHASDIEFLKTKPREGGTTAAAGEPEEVF